MSKRAMVAVLLLSAAVATPALAHQEAVPAPAAGKLVPKDQLLKPAASARHFVVVSDSAKHGDVWEWTLPDGRQAYRHSQSLRGWITETDAVATYNSNGLPVALTIRGVSPEGDAAETFAIKDNVASWSASADKGTSPASNAFYVAAGGPPLLDVALVNALTSTPGGVALLPSGRASLERTQTVAPVAGPGTVRSVRMAWLRGIGLSPYPVWLDEQDRFFGTIGWISMVPAGFEANAKGLRDLQDKATADAVKQVAARFLAPSARQPVLFDNVQLFDADKGAFLPGQAVLTRDGKIAAVGAAGSIAAPAGTRVVDGRGKSLLPGLWDSHKHVGNDWSLLSNMAAGITSFRSPGTMIDRAQSITRRRNSGELLAAEGWHSAIVDRKDPLAAQGATVVSSREEAIAAVRKIKDAGLWGVKFYTSMNPEWIAPAAAEAKRLGMFVHGHVPANMRPLEAVRAGYDELTHINFVVMQLMPQSVVAKANTAAGIEGPAKYAKDLDLDGAPARALIAELARRKTIVDPTLVVFEQSMTMDGGVPAPAYAPYITIVPPVIARSYKAGGHPLIENLTRDDYRRSFAKLVELTGALHKAGVTIVAGTDGEGIELVREIELYRDAGMTPAQALQSATIVPARLVGADNRTGSIAVGKEADVILVNGDVARDLGALRRTEVIVSDGYMLDAQALRTAAGFSGAPK